MIAVDSATHTAGLDTTRPAARVGSVAEFFLVGGVTPFVFFLSAWLRKTFGLNGPELAFGFTTFYAAFVINDPHFTVTYCLSIATSGSDYVERARPPGSGRGTSRREW